MREPVGFALMIASDCSSQCPKTFNASILPQRSAKGNRVSLRFVPPPGEVVEQVLLGVPDPPASNLRRLDLALPPFITKLVCVQPQHPGGLRFGARQLPACPRPSEQTGLHEFRDCLGDRGCDDVLDVRVVEFDFHRVVRSPPRNQWWDGRLLLCGTEIIACGIGVIGCIEFRSRHLP